MSTFVDQLRDLDPNDPSRWPLPFRLGAIALIFIVAASLMSYFLAWKDKKPELDSARAQESQPVMFTPGRPSAVPNALNCPVAMLSRKMPRSVLIQR